MVSKNDKIILLLPPKTGSKSFSGAFADAGVTFSKPVRDVPYPVYHLLLSEICHIFDIPVSELPQYKIIQVTRDPYDRMVSAWQHQMEITGIRMGLSDFLQKLSVVKSFLPHDTDSFYSRFYDDPDHKMKSFMKGNWGGLRFYFEQIWWNDLNQSVHYFKLEDLKVDVSGLSGLTGREFKRFPHIKVNKSIRLDGFNYYAGDIETNLVKELYNKDFKGLGYEF